MGAEWTEGYEFYAGVTWTTGRTWPDEDLDALAATLDGLNPCLWIEGGRTIHVTVGGHATGTDAGDKAYGHLLQLLESADPMGYAESFEVIDALDS